jgi:16S rRNA (cytosine967-C5)-methyltransferase
VLDRAVPLLKAGGRIAYITCSVLDEENGAQVRAFLARHPDFALTAPAKIPGILSDRTGAFRDAALMSNEGLLMTPRRTGTDGFFVSILRRT